MLSYFFGKKNDKISYEEEAKYQAKSLQTAIDELSKLEKSLRITSQDLNISKLMFLENIDIVKALDAIVYEVKINNELWDVKMIMPCIEYGFSQLSCGQSGWSK